MRLRILLPTAVLADTDTDRVTADGLHGSFTLLPRHVDTLAALVPGLLSYDPPDGPEVFVAVDGGLLVKYGTDVLVTTRRAVTGTNKASTSVPDPGGPMTANRSGSVNRAAASRRSSVHALR